MYLFLNVEPGDQPSKAPKKGLLSRLFPSLKEGFKKAREAKDRSFTDKVKIFFASFWAEMNKVEQEEGQVAADTKKAVAKGVDTTMEDARKAANLGDDVGTEDREFYDEILAITVAKVKLLEPARQTHVSEAMAKVKKAADGEEQDPLTLDQSSALAAVGIMTLYDLRKKYPEKGAFKAALDCFYGISGNSNYPLAKLLRKEALRIFKPDVSGSNLSGALALLENFNIDAAKAITARGLLAGLKKTPIENEKGIVDFLKEHIFPNTDEANLTMAVKTMNKMVISEDTIDTKLLADLVFYIDEEDYDYLARALLGKKATAETRRLGEDVS